VATLRGHIPANDVEFLAQYPGLKLAQGTSHWVRQGIEPATSDTTGTRSHPLCHSEVMREGAISFEMKGRIFC
jgi:hypothetical protein